MSFSAPTAEQLRQQPPAYVRLAFTDIDGVLRGKLIAGQKLLEALDHGLGFCDVVFGWDSADQLYQPNATLTGWHTAFPDQRCYPDVATLRPTPWQEGMPFLLADFDGSPAGEVACPRSLLKRIAARAAAAGYHVRMAQEFEWFNFRETPQSLADKQYQQPQPLTPGMFGYSILRPAQQQAFSQALFQQLTQFGVAIEGLHTETGPGVYEAAIVHDEVLAAADKAILLKAGVKEIAAQHGIMASFMAKWNAALPGCSGHLHQSLWTADGASNLFFDADHPQQMSQLMAHYVAGQLHCLPHLLPMYAPTINSYKRLVEGAWAPTTISWGVDNRTTAIRTLGGYQKATRAELRVPGADSNAYLVMAAALASGLYGIQQQLPLPPATEGNAYATDAARLPANLLAATQAMQQSALAKELLGEAFVDHFCHTRLHECQQYATAVTDWELKRYFEII